MIGAQVQWRLLCVTKPFDTRVESGLFVIKVDSRGVDMSSQLWN